MPNLTRTYRWERFEPHLGDNLELPPERRFYLEVASGLTKEQLEAFERATVTVDLVASAEKELQPERDRMEAVQKDPASTSEQVTAALEEWATKFQNAVNQALAAHFERALTPVVRLGAEPLTVDGTAITTLRAYLDLIVKLGGQYNLRELASTVRGYNTLEGAKALFSERPSGGGSSTRAKSSAAEAQRAGR